MKETITAIRDMFTPKANDESTRLVSEGTAPVDGDDDTAHVSQYGGRGRDAQGRPVAIPAGRGPAPPNVQDPIEKDQELPRRPPKNAKYVNVQLNTNTGEKMDDDLGFPCRGLIVDNYSSVWIFVSGADVYIPPFSVRWHLPIYQASSSLRVLASAPQGYTQPALTAGGTFSIVAVEEKVEAVAGVFIPTGVHP